MIDFFIENSALILTGILVTFISSFLYTMNAKGFIAHGKYRKKEEAVLIYLAAAVILGIITPLIHHGSLLILRTIPMLSIVGVLLTGANFIIHSSIPRWNHFSLKSLLIYLLGVILIIAGVLHLPEQYVFLG